MPVLQALRSREASVPLVGRMKHAASTASLSCPWEPMPVLLITRNDMTARHRRGCLRRPAPGAQGA